MTYWTLGQAAKETAKSKSQIHKAITDGRLSYVEKTTSGYKLDPSEVHRVFPQERSIKKDVEQYRTDENAFKNRLLEQKVEFLETQLQEAKNRLEDIYREKDKLFQIVERQTMLIEYHAQEATQRASKTPAEPRKGFLSWVIGSKT